MTPSKQTAAGFIFLRRRKTATKKPPGRRRRTRAAGEGQGTSHQLPGHGQGPTGDVPGTSPALAGGSSGGTVLGETPARRPRDSRSAPTSPRFSPPGLSRSFARAKNPGESARCRGGGLAPARPETGQMVQALRSQGLLFSTVSYRHFLPLRQTPVSSSLPFLPSYRIRLYHLSLAFKYREDLEFKTRPGNYFDIVPSSRDGAGISQPGGFLGRLFPLRGSAVTSRRRCQPTQGQGQERGLAAEPRAAAVPCPSGDFWQEPA